MSVTAGLDKLLGIIPVKKDVSSRTKPGTAFQRITPLDAGADILHRYQLQWAQMHEETVLASKTANEVEEMCSSLAKTTLTRDRIMSNFNSLLQSIPSMVSDIEEIERDLKKTIDSLRSLEEAIDARQECLFDEELKKRFDTQYVLKIHEQRLEREFEKISKSLEKDHRRKLDELKKIEELKIQQKQQEFQAAFERELMQYKTRGEIKKKTESGDENQAPSSPSLEDIIVQADEADQETLEKFLQEEEEEGGSKN